MNISQLTSPVPTLTPEDTCLKALDLMEEAKVSELPVVSEENYIALVKEDEILDWPKQEQTLSSSGMLHYHPAVHGGGHPFDAIRVMHEAHLSVLPVVDSNNKYMGSVTREGLLRYIAENSGIDKTGGIIVLEILPRNYTLYEIARICENEDVTIQNLLVHTTEQGIIEVTLKVNRTTLDAVVASLERHKYHVREVYGENVNNDDLTDKYNLLMNYINM